MAFGRYLVTPVGGQLDQEHSSPEFQVGTVGCDEQGNYYRYIQVDSTGASAQGQSLLLDPSDWLDADLLDATNGAGAYGQPVGITGGAITADYYAWVGIQGQFEVLVAANCAADAKVYNTATAGTIDDAATSGLEQVLGINITEAAGGSAGLVTAYIDHPSIGDTVA